MGADVVCKTVFGTATSKSAIAIDLHKSPPRQVELLAKHWQSLNHIQSLDSLLNDTYTESAPPLSLANWPHWDSVDMPEDDADLSSPRESCAAEHRPATDLSIGPADDDTPVDVTGLRAVSVRLTKTSF